MSGWYGSGRGRSFASEERSRRSTFPEKKTSSQLSGILTHHDLGHEKCYNIRQIRSRIANRYEELCHGDQKTPDRSYGNDADEKEGNVLGPEGDVQWDAHPVHSDFDSFRHRIHLSDSVEDDIDERDEDLPDAVDGKEVAEHVEIHPHECLAELDSAQHLTKLDKIEKQESG